jgi:hypothetical protein
VASNNSPAKTAGRPLGSTGEAVRKNISRIREEKGIAVTELSARLADLDRPIPPLGIHRIEDGTRRVDVDDLVTIALALGVSPITLLITNTEQADAPVAITGESRELSAVRVWAWLSAQKMMPSTPRLEATAGPMSEIRFRAHAWPTWLQTLDDETNHAALIDELREQGVSGLGDN